MVNIAKITSQKIRGHNIIHGQINKSIFKGSFFQFNQFEMLKPLKSDHDALKNEFVLTYKYFSSVSLQMQFRIFQFCFFGSESFRDLRINHKWIQCIFSQLSKFNEIRPHGYSSLRKNLSLAFHNLHFLVNVKLAPRHADFCFVRSLLNSGFDLHSK